MAGSNKFGTFGGVFTPSILTILGVIMYMRLPMIIGQAGLWSTIGIIVIAHIISIATGLSVSSIATDKKVKAGGTYYIISRSLGLPIGGTLGLALFVGLSFSVSLYLIGFAESFLGYWGFPLTVDNIRIAGSIILLTVTIITFISTSLAIKTQYLIMTAIFLSLLSIFFGRHDFSPSEPHFFNKESTVPLMVLFGIFFPAVTGFEAGVSMSGDLRDPKKSIPGGTITAIAIGLTVYIGLAFFFSYTVQGDMLASDPQVLLKISLVPQLVIAGIWGATLSSALGSILAAPRILQATALDKITPKFLEKGAGRTNEPRNALMLTFLIAESGILIGELDVIARIVSIFFITTYGFLNLSAAFEASTSADFRPSFRTPAWVSMIGAAACILVMIQLDFMALLGAIVILGLLFLYLKRKQLTLEGGDAWSSVWATLVKSGIKRLAKTRIHERNWRPNIILFSGNGAERPHLVNLGNSLSGLLGMMTGFELEIIKDSQLLNRNRRISRLGNQKNLILYKHICSDLYSGMDEIVRLYGFTGTEPNTMLMGWSKKEDSLKKFENMVRISEKNHINSLFLNYDDKYGFGNYKTIDIWWKGKSRNLSFAMNLIRHLTSAGEWKDSRIRLLLVVNHKADIEKAYYGLKEIVDRYRIDLEIKLINNSTDAYPWEEIVKKESAETDLIILGLPYKGQKQFENIYIEVNSLKKSLGTLLLIKASPEFEEYDLGLSGDREKTEKDAELSLVLPQLIVSKYPIINDDIVKIDSRGHLVLENLCDKIITPFHAENHQFFNEVKYLLANIAENLNKIFRYSDLRRRNWAIVKTRNDFYYRTKKVIEKLLNEQISMQQNIIEEGVKWYLDRLDQDVLKFPHRLTIDFNKEDFKLKKTDNPSLKWFKIRKKILHPFTRKNIPVRINYKAVADYYLKSTRHFFIHKLLKKFIEESEAVYSRLRPFLLAVDEQLDVFDKKIDARELKKDDIMEFEKTMISKIDEIQKEISTLEQLNRNRLFMEFRKNLQLFLDDLGRIDVNRIISKKRISKRYDKTVLLKISTFGELWYNDSINYFNKIYLDVLMQSYKNRIRDKINEFKTRFNQEIDTGLLKNIAEIKHRLSSFSDNFSGSPELKLSVLPEEEYFLFISDFEGITQEFRKFETDLPESLTIEDVSAAGSNPDQMSRLETITVPLRKLTGYILETTFIASVNDLLGSTMRSLKEFIFQLNDHLSLTRFNLENVASESESLSEIVDEIKKDTHTGLKRIEEKIIILQNGLIPLIRQKLDETFDSLSSHKIKESVDLYFRFRFDKRGRFAGMKFNLSFSYFYETVRRTSARLLYSKSEGVLLAKNLVSDKIQFSKNEEILDLIDRLSPNPEVLKALPYHYQNLFSGKSSIHEDFWVSRPVEDLQFDKAIKRIQSGIKGGILLLGERNSGKTALCMHVARIHFRDEKVYHIFLEPGSSASELNFLLQLKKSIGLSGEIDEIFDTLPYGSVVIIHDLELWWERAAQDFRMINLILNLIHKFNYKCIFIVNMNPFAFELINGIMKLERYFISIIRCQPFNSEELKEMVMRRHRSGGLKLRLEKKDEELLSEYVLAKLFNKYFRLSEGNPGTVLYQWLSNIVKVSSRIIHIRMPGRIDFIILEDLDEDSLVVLVQLSLQKRLLYDDLEKDLGLESPVAEEIINSLIRTGILQKRSDNLLMINPVVEPFVRKVLKHKGLV